ncbi:hypothetical protein ENT_22680 [Enterococcus faecalis]|jgi:hypothetical protein|nr:hypothetical protein EF10244_13380 [Enterococcus faecalis 10244]ETC90825.1 hypothetical protein T481_16165 [Enterococcus faecalis PF3]CBL32600.1 hypothetical protein ENT_22680 [Enterococcus faecalis]
MKSLGKGLAFFRVFIIIVKDNEVFEKKEVYT